jgi:hypothetical protein
MWTLIGQIHRLGFENMPTINSLKTIRERFRLHEPHQVNGSTRKKNIT